MTTTDQLARLRDAFTLEEAARVISGVPLSRVYPPRADGWTQDLRDEHGKVQGWLRELEATASNLGVTTTHYPAHRDVRVNSFTGQPYDAGQRPAQTKYGKVSRAALVAWCEARGLRPSALFEPEGRPDSGSVGVAEMNANRALAAMALLLARSVKKFQQAGKPNVSQIGSAVDEAASKLFGDDATGLKQFRKRLAQALKEFPDG